MKSIPGTALIQLYKVLRLEYSNQRGSGTCLKSKYLNVHIPLSPGPGEPRFHIKRLISSPLLTFS